MLLKLNVTGCTPSKREGKGIKEGESLIIKKKEEGGNFFKKKITN